MPVLGSLRAHRYVGLAGSAALAAGAYQIGALPGLADADALAGRADLTGVLACLSGLIALTVAWWRIGMACTGPRPAPSGRWMFVTATLWALPVLVAPPLASRDVYAYACHGALIRAGLDPHQVTPAAMPCPWLDSVPPIWRTAASPYGPLAGLLSAGAAALSDGEVSVTVVAFRLVAVVGVLLAVWSGRGLAVACGVTGARAAWLGLASPLVIVHAFAGAHHDALMAGLVLAAFALALPSRSPRVSNTRGDRDGRASVPRGAPGGWAVVSGLVLGLAVAVKVTALVALPFLVVLLSPRHRDRAGVGGAPVTMTAGVMVIVTASAGLSYAVTAMVSGLGLGFRHGLVHTGDLVQWTSVPTAVGMAVGYAGRALGVALDQDMSVTVARLAGLAAAAVVAVMAWWAAWHSPAPTAGQVAGHVSGSGLADRDAIGRDMVKRAVRGGGVAFVAITLLGPVNYPWYALTPLALLAVSVTDDRVRAWLGVAGATLVFLILPNGVGLAARTKLAGAGIVTATVIVLTIRWLRAPPRAPTPAGPSGPAT